MSDKLSPLAGYYGGKFRMSKHIADIIQGEQWRTYIEPFCGGANVFFQMDIIPHRGYVLNDIDGRIINFWMVAKHKPAELDAMINARCISSQLLHDRAREHYRASVEITHATQDVELAWAVWYMIRLSMQGMLDKPMLKCITLADKTAKNMRNKRDALPAALSKMENAFIENMDALKIIEFYDNEETIIYLDPPYVKTAQAHYAGYGEADFIALLDKLSALKSKFVLSHYDNPILIDYVNRCGWQKIEIELACYVNTFASGNVSKRRELVIYNFTRGNKLL